MNNKSVRRFCLNTDDYMAGGSLYIYAKQYDANSRIIRVDLQDSNGHINITGTPQLNCKKPDGTVCYIIGTANPDGTADIILTSGLLAAEGTITCDISVFASDGSDTILLTSQTFYIVVEASNYNPQAIESINEFAGITTQLASISQNGINEAGIDSLLQTLGSVLRVRLTKRWDSVNNCWQFEYTYM